MIYIFVGFYMFTKIWLLCIPDKIFYIIVCCFIFCEQSFFSRFWSDMAWMIFLFNQDGSLERQRQRNIQRLRQREKERVDKYMPRPRRAVFPWQPEPVSSRRQRQWPHLLSCLSVTELPWQCESQWPGTQDLFEACWIEIIRSGKSSKTQKVKNKGLSVNTAHQNNVKLFSTNASSFSSCCLLPVFSHDSIDIPTARHRLLTVLVMAASTFQQP